MLTIPIPKALLVQDVNSYSAAGDARKKAFHTSGRKFLKALAQYLDVDSSEYRLSSNVAGIAVSGEVTLHTDQLYVQLSESCVGERGISMLYRTCKGRKDYCGGPNNFVNLKRLEEPEVQNRVLANLRDMTKAPAPV